MRRHIVIRPLAYVAERDIARYARARGFPIIPCTLCGSQENLQRVAMKKMLADWELEFPGRSANHLRGVAECAARASGRSAPLRFRRPRATRITDMTDAEEQATRRAPRARRRRCGMSQPRTRKHGGRSHRLQRRRCRIAIGCFRASCSPVSTRSPTRSSRRAQRLQALLGAGIDCFLDLTMPQELQGYDSELPPQM